MNGHNIKALLNRNISDYSSDGLMLSAARVFWHDKTKILYRESGSRRLVEVKLINIKLGLYNNWSYYDMPPVLGKDSMIEDVCLHTSGRLVLLTCTGRIWHSGNIDQVIELRSNVNTSWLLVKQIFGCRILVAGLENRKPRISNLLRLYSLSGVMKCELKFGDELTTSLYQLKRIMILKRYRYVSLLMGVSIRDQIHIFQSTLKALSLIKLNVRVCEIVKSVTFWSESESVKEIFIGSQGNLYGFKVRVY